MEQRLIDLRLDLTSYCNETCIFCPFHGYDEEIKEGQFIDGDYFIRVAEDLRLNSFRVNARFVGSGEPTLHPDFIKILKEKSKYVILILNTYFTFSIILTCSVYLSRKQNDNSTIRKIDNNIKR